MPTMVMSQPPKTNGDNSLRKRQKNRNDNILAVNSLYVGSQEQFTIYVRERLVYRSNVEVTYDDIYSYMASYTNDDTVSLHYSVNGLYVPITTTGQLHTFLRHVHNNPATILYVENQEFVWNVAAQNEGHKMEKRVQAGPVAAGDGVADAYHSVDEDLSQDEKDRDRVAEDDSEDDEEDEEEEEEEAYESRIPAVLTNNTAPVVFVEKIPVKEAFMEPKPRVLPKPKTNNNDEKKSGPPKQPEKLDNVDRNNVSDALPNNEKWTERDAFNKIKDLLTNALAEKTMSSAPEQVSKELVLNVWNPAFPHDDKVFKDTVGLVRTSVGCGILCYYDQVMKKLNPDRFKNSMSEPIEKTILTDKMPAHDPELLAEFIDCAIIAACDMLESVQHLTQLRREFEYFNELNGKLERNEKLKQNEKLPIPTYLEVYEHIKTAVSSAHFGFNVTEPIFLSGCECQEATRTVTCELQKLLLVLDNVRQKSNTPQQVLEIKNFVIESAHKIVGRYTDKLCPQHKTFEMALRASEIHKYRSEITVGFDQWVALRDGGENRLNISPRCFEIELDRPRPYALMLESSAGDPNVAPITHSLGDMNVAAAPGNPPDSGKPLQEQTTKASIMNSNSHLATNDSVTQTTTATTNVSASTIATTTGQAAGGGTATISKKMSDELQRLVDNMYKNVPAQHNYVYPPPPKPGAILIPTGGLARCRCSKNCPETLMEPAYEYIERFNEPRQTVWEKTKQKRYKKN